MGVADVRRARHQSRSPAQRAVAGSLGHRRLESELQTRRNLRMRGRRWKAAGLSNRCDKTQFYKSCRSTTAILIAQLHGERLFSAASFGNAGADARLAL